MDDPITDPILAALVAFAERNQSDGKSFSSVELTLQMGGLVVIGDLISQARFFELCGEPFAIVRQAVEEQAEDTAIAEGLTLAGAERQNTRDLVGGFPQFLHLCRAQFWLPGLGGAPSDSTDLWRGRIDRVDAFTVTPKVQSGTANA